MNIAEVNHQSYRNLCLQTTKYISHTAYRAKLTSFPAHIEKDYGF